MKNRILAIVSLLFIFLPQGISAAELPSNKGFAVNYDTWYDVDETGLVKVVEKVVLRNLTPEYYADEFKLTAGGDIFDIKAQDPGGSLPATVEQKDGSHIINVKFNQQVAGLGKTLPWTIAFKAKGIAEKTGRIWEVKIPKISSAENVEAYSLKVSVPQSFGEPSFINPLPKSQVASGGKIFFTFDLSQSSLTRSQLKTTGVSAVFGNYQLFDFDLTYHLENLSLAPGLKNITLPPDTSFQDVIYKKIDPQPLNVSLDSDGNYLAWFRLDSGQKLDVFASGSAKIYPSSKVKHPVLEQTLRERYTKAPGSTSFITSSRAAGIPARELNGYGYRSKSNLAGAKDSLTWPEYWDDRRGWVMVDPDFEGAVPLNRLVFRVAGPAKDANKDRAGVKLTLSDTDFLGRPQISVQIMTPDLIFAGFPGKARIKITNTGNAFYPSTLFTVSAGKLIAGSGIKTESGIIPAFGTSQFDFDVHSQSLFDSYDDEILVSIGSQKFTKDIKIRPFVLFQTGPAVEFILGLMVVVYIIVLGGHIYRGRQRLRKIGS